MSPAESDSTARTLEIDVPSEHDGERLDRFLQTALPERTRSDLRRVILAGRVDVAGSTAGKPGLIVTAGARIVVRLPEAADRVPRPEAIELRVVFEDDALVVVDKPPSLVVHPGHGRPDGTLVNALLGRGTMLSGVGAPERPGIVHRLDRGTSGLIVVAKTDRAHHALAAAFADRLVSKRYVSLVWGRLATDSGTIDRTIGRSPRNPVKMSVASRRGREALTHYRVIERPPGFTLLEVHPETGRTHQIRVHLQSLNHPLVGDTLYGGQLWRGVQDVEKRNALRDFERLGLHASRLAFKHPLSGEALHFEAPLPSDFAQLLVLLRGR